MDQTAKICQDTKVYSGNLKRREAVYSGRNLIKCNYLFKNKNKERNKAY